MGYLSMLMTKLISVLEIELLLPSLHNQARTSSYYHIRVSSSYHVYLVEDRPNTPS